MGIPKPTENTVTVFLKNELEKFGVKALPFASISTPVGRREIDLLCKNAGIYPIEAKFTESELLIAISKIQNDYLKYHRELGIKGGFAILYPNKLSEPIPIETLQKMLKTLKFKVVSIFLPEDIRKNFTVCEGTLTEIAQELSKHILTPPKYIEPNVEWIIKSLREAANYITIGLKHLAGKQLEEIFGGEHVFKNILNYEEKKYPTAELKLASAYLLVNQLLFYHVLSRRVGFPEIDTDKLKEPSQLNQYFKLVLDINYRAIFTYDVASKIPRNYIEIIKVIIDVIKSISPEKISGDLLGTIFHDLIPLDVRKYIGAFYTNVLAANLLAWLAIDRYDAKVADFAVGSGGLLVAAYRRKKYLFELERKEFSQKTHEKFIEQLLGIDVMPFAASVAASHLALQSPQYHTNKVNIAIWDSTELKPNLKIPSIAELSFVLRGQARLDMFPEVRNHVKGVVRLGEEEPEEIILTKYDVVIMNPPFTRQERIPENYKKELFYRSKEYGKYLHGQLGYYGYFILLADRFLDLGGRLAFVLPAAFLRVRSAKGVRKFLSEKYNVEYIITGKKRLNFSESTWRREILFVARKMGKGERKKDTVVAAIEKLPQTMEELERICAKIKGVKGSYEDHEIFAFTVNHKKFEDNLDWFRFIAQFQTSGVSEIWEMIKDSAKNLAKFGEVYNVKKVLKRGIETAKGMNVHAVFILSSIKRAIRKEDAWILERVENEEVVVFNRYLKNRVKIPKRCVMPCLRTFADNRSMDITGKTDLVVIRDFKNASEFFFGDRAKYRKVLPTWEKYAKDRTGNLIILRRFVINAPGTVHLSYYSSIPVIAPGTTWVSKLDSKDAKILNLWFNSSINLAQILYKRIEDVWFDIHKYVLSDFYIINPYTLEDEVKNKILNLFDKISKQVFPSLEKQYAPIFELKKEIDKAILFALGFNKIEAEELMSDLYDALYSEFKALRKMN
ncbi:hypothetical protein DRP05_12825 [Archaeoglobales archaeon]|nr:MAG: hypothetical protein DRP05_12825 [Archaeoglobales archaeon]